MGGWGDRRDLREALLPYTVARSMALLVVSCWVLSRGISRRVAPYWGVLRQLLLSCTVAMSLLMVPSRAPYMMARSSALLVASCWALSRRVLRKVAPCWRG